MSRRYDVLALIIVATALLPPVAVAAQGCFCLVNEDDGVLFGCVEVRRLPGQPKILCEIGPDGELGEADRPDARSRVPEGTSPCTPCRRVDASDPRNKIRGDKGETPPASDTGTNDGATGAGANESTAPSADASSPVSPVSPPAPPSGSDPEAQPLSPESDPSDAPESAPQEPHVRGR